MGAMRVCMLSEGCYPVRPGGLSALGHAFIRWMPDVRFQVYALTSPEFTTPVFPTLPNIDSCTIAQLLSPFPRKEPAMPAGVSQAVGRSIQNVLRGTPLDLEVIVDAYRRYGLDKNWLLSRACWDSIVDYCSTEAPEEPFADSFWTIVNLYSLVFDTLSVLPNIPKADVYHALSVGHAGVIGALAKTYHDGPMVLTEQGLYLVERQKELSRPGFTPFFREQHMRYSESLLHTCYQHADRVVPPSSQHVAMEIKLGLPREKIQVIQNGIEVDRFPPGPPRDSAIPVVSCFARVVPIKGLEVLIEAARLVLQKHEAEFFVLGEVQEEDYYGQCLRQVEEAGIGERFKFMGHVDTLEWYHRTDIFTLTSHSEGVPYSLLEAMSCGLPSVCTAVGGVPDIVTEDVGYLVPPNRPDELAERLGRLISDRGLRQRMGKNATEVAAQKHDVRKMAASFEELYWRVIDDRRNRRG